MTARKPVVAVLGMAIESSVYAAHRAGYRDFSQLSGEQVIARYDFLRPGTELGDAADWRGVFYARSIPGGQVEPEVYSDFRQRMVRGLAELLPGGLDGILLDLHGAMSVVDQEDAEGNLVDAIRAVVGPGPLISSPMDLHGNVSERFFAGVDLPTCFRTAPHEDVWETRERAARNLLRWLSRSDRPLRARVAVPILLPGERTSTRVEPARGLYELIPGLVATDGVTDASIWIGYAWADEPRCHAAVVVTGDDRAAIARGALDLAGRLWRARDDFAFVGPPGSLAEGVDRALAQHEAHAARPYLISDSGDNPGAGGTGDVTWTLQQLLAEPQLTGPDAPLTYVASIFDPAAIEELFSASLGDQVDLTAGARVDHRVSPPVRITGTLVGQHEGDPDARRIAVIAKGGLRIIVTEFRKAFHAVDDFSSIGLNPAEADIIVTKIGYLEPTLHDIAKGWTLALTPGPVDQDLERLGHHRIQRPMFPFDTFEQDPELAVTIL